MEKRKKMMWTTLLCIIYIFKLSVLKNKQRSVIEERKSDNDIFNKMTENIN